MANEPLSTEARIFVRHLHLEVRRLMLADTGGTDWEAYDTKLRDIIRRDISPLKAKRLMLAALRPIAGRGPIGHASYGSIAATGNRLFRGRYTYIGSGPHPFDQLREHGLITSYRRYFCNHSGGYVEGSELSFISDHTLGRLHERSDLSFHALLLRLLALASIIRVLGDKHVGGGITLPLGPDVLLTGVVRTKPFTNALGDTNPIPFLDVRTALPPDWLSDAQRQQAALVGLAMRFAVAHNTTEMQEAVDAIPAVAARQDYIARMACGS